MHEITATFRNGQIELSQPVQWPDGLRVKVVPLLNEALVGESHSDGGTNAAMTHWPDGFLEQIRAQWEGPLERPSQGDFELREDW